MLSVRGVPGETLMHSDLAHWLTEQQPRLLPAWEAALHAMAKLRTNANGYAGSGATFDGLPGDETRTQTLGQIYEGLVRAARGEFIELSARLYAISQIEGWHEVGLPDLLAVLFQFRQQAWELLEQELDEPAQTFGLMSKLTLLLEHTSDALARSWETYTEATIRDRISQAEFIAESLAAATEEADRRALQLSALNRVLQRFSASLESDDLLDMVGTSLLEVLGVAHIAIWLPHADADEYLDDASLYVAQTWGSDPQPIVGMRLMESHSDIIFKAHSQAIIICETFPNAIRQGAWYLEGCGVLALPLLVNERSTGVIVLQDPDPSAQLSRSQQDLARGIAMQAAIALENARLYARIRRFNNELEQLVARRTHELLAEKDRLSTLYEITREVSSTLDLDALLNGSLAALARIAQAGHGSIMLIEPDTEHLVSRASLGHTESVFTRFPIGVGIAGWVAQKKQPALIDDVSQDERWVALPPDDNRRKREGSMVVVPLMAQNEVVGVLTLSHRQTGFFNEDHLRLLTASAGGIAVGIHNANLYNTIVSETERRGELLRTQQETTSKLAAILQSLSDGVLVCDTDGRVLSTNAAAGRILQRDIEELVLWNLHDLLPRYLPDRIGEMPLTELLARPLDSSGAPRIFQSMTQVGVRVVSLALGPVLREEDGELIGALLVLRDITREVESDRLKTEFIGTMSHELRTPMTAIKGFTQLLAMGSLGALNDTQRELLNTIYTNAERMISIINDVLDITKIETGSIDLELRSLHLAETLSGVIADLQPLIRDRGHNLTVHIPPGLLLVRADSSRLHQVLYNLVSNAVKYTRHGGNIEIDVHEAVPGDLPEWVRDNILSSRRYVQVNVRDTGVGIAPEELDQVFERFYRTENPLKIEAGGTGLGLSLARPLVELLGGHIWVESVLNEGSTFSFILPAA